MIEYKTPSIAAFHHRLQFHAAHKAQNESITDWFKRLQKFINHCEFAHISDYMLIDKFVSGLGDADFEKISQVATWTIEELILVVIGNAHIFNRNISSKDSSSISERIEALEAIETKYIKAENTVVSMSVQLQTKRSKFI